MSHNWKDSLRKQHSGYRSRRARRRLSTLESLEPRLVLAGNITTALAGGTLTVTGDDASNSLNVTSTGNGLITLEGVDGTTIVGETEFEGINNLIINLKRGHDRLDVDLDAEPPTVEFVAADGDAFDLTVDAGAGNDFISLAGTVHNLLVTADGGNDEIRLGLEFPGEFRVEGSGLIATGQGSDIVDSFGADVHNLSVFMGKGDDVIDGWIVAEEAVKVGMEIGNDRMSADLFSNASASVDLGFGNDLMANMEIPAAAVASRRYSPLYSHVRVEAGESVLIRGGDGNDKVYARATGKDGSPPPVVKIDLGEGDDLLAGDIDDNTPEELGVAYYGSTRITQGASVGGGAVEILGQAGNDQILLESCFAQFSLTIDLGEGDDLLAGAVENRYGKSFVEAPAFLEVAGPPGKSADVAESVAAGPGLLTITGGDGNDDVQFDGRIFGDALVDTGEGDDFLRIGGEVGSIFGQDLNVFLQDGNDDFEFYGATVDQNLNIQAGWLDDDLELREVHVGGTTNINADFGSDRLDIIDSVFEGDFSSDLGYGDDELQLGGPNAELPEGGVGAVSYDEGNEGNLFQGLVNVKSGEGDDLLVVQGNTFEMAATVETNKGADRVFVGLAGPGWYGNGIQNSGNTGNNFQAAASVDLGAGTDTLNAANNVAAGPTLLDGGNDDDTYIDGGNNSGDEPTVVNFEFV